MGNKVKTRTVNLGRLPVYCGGWHDKEDGYHKYNIATYYGSSFINLVEGNKKYPVRVTLDSDGRLVSYSFEYIDGTWTGWMFVANSMDSSIYAMNMGDYAKYEADRIIKSKADIYISSTHNVIYPDTTYSVTVNAIVNSIEDVSKITMSINGLEVAEELNTNTISYTTDMNVSTDQVITIDCVISEQELSDSMTIKVVDPIYYGIGNVYSDAQLKPTPRLTPEGSYVINITTPNRYIFFNIPEEMDINTVSLNGMNIPFSSPQIVTIDDKVYKSYKSAYTFDSANITVKVG